MSNLVIKDLDVETVLDRKTMASVTGGFFMLGLYQLVANAAANAIVEEDEDKITGSWTNNSGSSASVSTVIF